jgi:UDP-2,3-diacylglucosamine pyrophosphatase LpxH
VPPKPAKRAKRKPDVVVISDVHLGTPSCRSADLLRYLLSIKPKKLVIDGDLCDLGSYFRNAWAPEHLLIVRRILKMAAKGTEVYYVTGNHDAPLRKYSGMSLGGVHLVDRLELTYGDKRALVIHGDCFDGHIQVPGWVKKLGGWIYDLIMKGNNLVNRMRGWFGKAPVSLATLIKNNVGMAQKYIERFRTSSVDAAKRGRFDAVICGHIHEADNQVIDGILYLNSGDWVEHCTSLEYADGEWQVVHCRDLDYGDDHDEEDGIATDTTVDADLLKWPAELIVAA